MIFRWKITLRFDIIYHCTLSLNVNSLWGTNTRSDYTWLSGSGKSNLNEPGTPKYCSKISQRLLEDCPQIAQRLPTNCPQIAHGLPTAFPQIAHSLPTECLWISFGLPTWYLLITYELIDRGMLIADGLLTDCSLIAQGLLKDCSRASPRFKGLCAESNHNAWLGEVKWSANFLRNWKKAQDKAFLFKYV